MIESSSCRDGKDLRAIRPVEILTPLCMAHTATPRLLPRRSYGNGFQGAAPRPLPRCS
jgi:hypothetical protein